MSLRTTLGLVDENRLGSGGESDVFALGGDRVVRVLRGGGIDGVNRRRSLLDKLGTRAGEVSFAIPQVLEVIEEDGELATIEARLPGEPLDVVLARRDIDRRGLLRAYLGASKEIVRLTPENELYGDLARDESIRTHTFIEYAIARAHQNLRVAGPEFEAISALEIASALAEAPPALVHVDFFPGNVLVEDGRISAVLDFGETSLIGDRRIDAIAAALYLDPEITPAATDADRDFARTWVEANELLPLFEPVRRWLAAFWSAARDDASLRAWCARILLE